ncbi:hypothetical protein DPEC_G00045830 [Dallia pectoralis]|uniref:Uncharacterized protein n=1 Tax=Dallia pectoralis TaxID=75939 RepID=A0ACC2HA09_DALPE|nr:hypothetical protein DPEC_G00045830 [Dallia pectoralis]
MRVQIPCFCYHEQGTVGCVLWRNLRRSYLRSNYLLNSCIAGIEEADLLLLVGTNPRYKAPHFNARIRKSWLHNELHVALVGSQEDQTYMIIWGSLLQSCKKLLQGPTPSLRFLPRQSVLLLWWAVLPCREMMGPLFTQQCPPSLRMPVSAVGGWKVLNVLHRVASQVAALDLGYKQGVETCQFTKGTMKMLGQRWLIFLPGAAYTEKCSTYVNTEGRAQLTRLALTAPGLAKNIRDISEY